MFNHFRTLLLNMDGHISTDTNYPGEELVPSDFRSVTLPQHIKSIRSTIFGPAPDRAMLNYRIRSLLPLVHTPKFEQFVLELDSRITYVPFDNNFYDLSLVQATVDKVVGDNNLIITGIKPTNDTTLYHQFYIKIWNPTDVQIRRITEPTSTNTLSYTVTNGISDALPFTGFPMFFSFVPFTGSEWQVSFLITPTTKIGTLFTNLLINNSNDIETLFSTPQMDSTFIALRSIWTNHRQIMPNRLAALVVALVYRTEELRIK